MVTKMDYGAETKENKNNFIAAYICFITFGVLVAVNKAISVISLALAIFTALLLAIVTIELITWSFIKANPDVCAQSGRGFAREAVSQGMLFMIPFTVLAVLADVLLGWDAVMPFASAAIMTAGASAGMEAVKIGAKGMKNVILPSVIAFIISTLWMLLVGLLP